MNSTRTHFSADVNALPLAAGGKKSLIFDVISCFIFLFAQ